MPIHLDRLGGLAGDMFIASVLDAFPEHESAVVGVIDSLQAPFERHGSTLRVARHDDGIFSGSRFLVEDVGGPAVRKGGFGA